MKLLLKQRIFSWLDSYDIYDEFEEVAYRVEGELAFGHCLNVYDKQGNKLGTIKQKVVSFY